MGTGLGNRFVAGALAAVLGACSGGPTIPSTTPAGANASLRAEQNTARSKNPVLARFVIHIPRKRREKHAANYISPATKSIGIVVDPGAHQIVLSANVTLGSPGCTTNACTFLLDLLPGAHSFNVTTYDATLSGGVPHGNVLSRNLGFPFTVLRGGTNAIGVALQGIPASFVMTPSTDEDVQGNQYTGFRFYGAYKADGTTIFPRAFNIATLDADGNVITGSGAPVISAVSDDTLALSSGTAAASSPNRFTIVPGGAVGGQPATFTLTARPSRAPGTNSGSTPLTATIGMQVVTSYAPRIFVSDQTSNAHEGRVWVFDELGKPVTNVQANLDAAGNLGEPAGMAYCPGIPGHLFVANEIAQIVDEFDDQGILQHATGVSSRPLGAACDSGGTHLYVSLAGGPVSVFIPNAFPSTYVTSGTWHEPGTSAYPDVPWGVVASPDGVFVADAAQNCIVAFDATGDPEIEFTLANAPFGLATYPGEYDFPQQLATERDTNAIVEFISAAQPGFPNLNGPFGIQYDPGNGSIYIAQYYGDAVTRYDTSGNQMALPAGAFSGPLDPVGVAVAP